MLARKLLIASLIGCLAATSEATLYRLDYSGQLTHTTNSTHQVSTLLDTPIEFSGYVMIDSTVQGTPVNSTATFYYNMSVAGEVTFGDTTYVLNPSDPFNLTGVVDSSPLLSDQFAFVDSYTNTTSNDQDTLLLQFQVFASDWLFSQELPGPFDLSDVDGFDPGSGNSTQAVLFTGGSEQLYGGFTHAEFRQVPLPGGIFLMISAMLALRTFRARQ